MNKLDLKKLNQEVWTRPSRTAKDSRACDFCRRRKIKCETKPGSEICTLCSRLKKACTYNDPVLKRGPKGTRKRTDNKSPELKLNSNSPQYLTKIIKYEENNKTSPHSTSQEIVRHTHDNFVRSYNHYVHNEVESTRQPSISFRDLPPPLLRTYSEHTPNNNNKYSTALFPTPESNISNSPAYDNKYNLPSLASIAPINEQPPKELLTEAQYLLHQNRESWNIDGEAIEFMLGFFRHFGPNHPILSLDLFVLILCQSSPPPGFSLLVNTVCCYYIQNCQPRNQTTISTHQFNYYFRQAHRNLPECPDLSTRILSSSLLLLGHVESNNELQNHDSNRILPPPPSYYNNRSSY